MYIQFNTFKCFPMPISNAVVKNIKHNRYNVIYRQYVVYKYSTLRLSYCYYLLLLQSNMFAGVRVKGLHLNITMYTHAKVGLISCYIGNFFIIIGHASKVTAMLR